MSTTIAGGLRLRYANLEQALSLLKGIRPACIDAARASTARQVAKQLAEQFDLQENLTVAPVLEARPGAVHWAIHDKFGEAKRRVLGRGERDPVWDATLEVCLIPNGRDLLAVYLAEKDLGYLDALIQAGFEEFQYDNSAERPEDISEFDWAARRTAWSDILRSGEPLGALGLSYAVVTWDDYGDAVFDEALIVAEAPSEESRRRSVTLALAALEVYSAAQRNGVGSAAMARMAIAHAENRISSVSLREGLFEPPFEWSS